MKQIRRMLSLFLALALVLSLLPAALAAEQTPYRDAASGSEMPDVYRLTVVGGVDRTGDGSYPAGTRVQIRANAPREGEYFTGWSANGKNVLFGSQTAAETYVVMPARDMTVTANYRPAPQKAYDGYVTVSFEDYGVRPTDERVEIRNPVGTILAPTLVGYYTGENVAQVTVRLLEQNNIDYTCSGSPESRFYLASIQNFYVGGTKIDSLGEIENGEGSGWMISYNDWFIDLSASEFSVEEGDVIRWQYTCQLGADLNAGRDTGSAEITGLNFRQNDGVLSPAFDEAVASYTYTVGKDVTQIWLEAVRTNRWAKLTYYVDGREHKGTHPIPVKNGTQIRIECEYRDFYGGTAAVDTDALTILLLVQGEPHPDDTAAAEAVDAQIAAIGEVTAGSGAVIAAARRAYEALTDTQKALVENLPILEAAEAAYDTLLQDRTDEEAAEAVDAQIAAIGEVTANSGAAIEAARWAYEALTDVQKGLVKNLSVLEAAEAAYAALLQNRTDEEAAEAVDAQIAAIGEVTANSGAVIAAARRAYEALTDVQKALVKNMPVLEATEAAYDALVQAQQEQAANEAAAKAVTEKIDAIGEVTLNSGDAIEAARKAYNALTDAQKALVENLSKLEAAEKAYAALVQAQQEQAADEAAAKAVTEKIDAIGEVTLNSGDAIEAARKAYNALTDAQKALVKNLPVLEAAEKAYAALQTAPSPFTDVESGSYYYDAVLWAAQQGIAKGITAATFCPQRDCTRGQIVTFLWRAFGQPTAKQSAPFTDVKRGDYCYEAVQWAVEQGITTGVTATSFQPQAVCTRAQAVTFLWRAKGKPETAAEPAFTDLQPGAYYLGAVAWAVANGVTTGVTDTTFCPERVCTRGQIVTFLHRALMA